MMCAEYKKLELFIHEKKDERGGKTKKLSSQLRLTFSSKKYFILLLIFMLRWMFRVILFQVVVVVGC